MWRVSQVRLPAVKPRDLQEIADRCFVAVLFDLDGTLIDSTPAVIRSWRRWAEEEGVPSEDLAAAHHHGTPAVDTVDRLIPLERRQAALERIARIEETDVDGIRLLPGAARAVATTSERAAVVTSCTRRLAAARMGAVDLAPPALVVTIDDTPVGKPAPDPYLFATDRLGVDPADCLVVEDAPQGCAAARAAGCVVLALGTTHSVDDLDADAAVPDLAAVQWRINPRGIQVAPRRRS